jgi:hypothetical protein
MDPNYDKKGRWVTDSNRVLVRALRDYPKNCFRGSACVGLSVTKRNKNITGRGQLQRHLAQARRFECHILAFRMR